VKIKPVSGFFIIKLLGPSAKESKYTALPLSFQIIKYFNMAESNESKCNHSQEK
jgi:hypothetical protein